MKKIVALAFGVCLLGGTLQAQTIDSKYGVDSAQTVINASIYTEFVKQKNFKDALPGWRYVFNNAPKFRLNTYTRGEQIMLGMLKQTKNYAYLDTLMMIYDQRIKYFGNNTKGGKGYVLGRKGGVLIQEGKKDLETRKRAFGYLTQSFEMEKMRSHPTTVQLLFYAAGELLNKNAIERDSYIDLYMKISAYVDFHMKNSKKPEAFKRMKGMIDGMFFNSGVADCATLNRLLTSKFEAKPDDVENLSSISRLLRRHECVDLPLYASVAEKLYQLDPVADAAYSLAIMFIRRQDFTKAETYLKEAIEKSDDEEAKGDYYFRMAQMKVAKKEYAAAKSNAIKALQINPSNGQAYILIGKAYAAYASQYGEDAFDHASVFWAAVDKFNRAKQVDPSVADAANELIRTYSQHFPNKEEAFFRSVTEGSTVKLGGWINETTKARFSK